MSVPAGCLQRLWAASTASQPSIPPSLYAVGAASAPQAVTRGPTMLHMACHSMMHFEIMSSFQGKAALPIMLETSPDLSIQSHSTALCLGSSHPSPFVPSLGIIPFTCYMLSRLGCFPVLSALIHPVNGSELFLAAQLQMPSDYCHPPLQLQHSVPITRVLHAAEHSAGLSIAHTAMCP